MTLHSRYQPIEDYAVIGDTRTVALISRQGSIDWLCLPNYASPALFASILDPREGGHFAVRPTDPFDTQRRYIHETNVLETTFRTHTGIARLVDLMPVLTGSGQAHLLQPQREVLRIIECQAGQVDMEVMFEPRPSYGGRCTRFLRRGALGWRCEHQDAVLMLQTDIALAPTSDKTAVHGITQLAKGQKHYLSLGYTQRDVATIALLADEAEARLAATVGWWQSWSANCSLHGRYRPAVIRSVLTLKLLTYALSGAVVAAATTSLPEEIGGVRNWDYRFCWLRDAALTLRSYTGLGYLSEARAFTDWMLHATRLSRPKLQVLYDIYGETRLSEWQLDHLEGYKGSRPVRVGNAAQQQLQLDTYGAVILAVTDHVMQGSHLDRSEARLLRGFGLYVCRHWKEPDEGIWEIRGPRRQHTYSKLMCWVALDCLLKLNQRGALRIPEKRFRKERDAIRDAIESRGFNRELNSYVAVFEGSDPDASLLLMARYGYLDGRHPRMQGTYEYIERTLGCRNGLLYRYRRGTDGLPGAEGAFGLASFWAVDYLARCGRMDEAKQRFDSLMAYANDVGLFSEEIDAETGAALGNFPQAFTHVGVITSALTLTEMMPKEASREQPSNYPPLPGFG